MTTLERIEENNKAILKFAKAFDSVDRDKAGKDQEKPLSKKALVAEIKGLALENKFLFEEKLIIKIE